MDERLVLTNMAMTRIGSVLVTCIGTNDLTDQEVDQMIKRFGVADFESILFSARGAGPNSKQRARIAEFWKSSSAGKPPRTVVISDSAAARFVTQVFSWLLGMDVKCLPSRDLAQGLAHLGSPAPLADVSGALAGLHAAVEFKQKRTG